MLERDGLEKYPVVRSRKVTCADVSSTTTSSTDVRLVMRIRDWASACSNRIGSRNIWLMRCGGSGVGQLQSGPSVLVKRSRRQGIGIRASSGPVNVVR